MTTHRRGRPLYRDPDDKMLGGVCSGLGHYFDIDTVLVRVAFVVVALLGGGGVLAYLILWALLDPAPPGELDSTSEPEPRPVEAPPPPTALEDTVTTAGNGVDHDEVPADPPSPGARPTDQTP